MNDLLGGRYRLTDPLGRGGMGTVYAAIQEGLGRRVAVKILDARLAEDRQQLERFRREAEIVAALGHPNIVQVTDFQYPEKDGDQPFLVMELLRGESLGMLLAREQVITAQRAAFVVAQVLSALTAAHRAGVVHRDIKPDNIFLLGDAAVPDTVKVLDFGIAKLAVEGQAKLTGTGAMLGTPAFMAPEQARGEMDVDGRADIYAVGATMYQSLSGRLPHEAPSIPALLFAIVEKTPQSLGELRPDLPADLVAIVERAMAKDRNERFPDADAMRRALAPWSGLPASLPPPTSATAATVASGNIAPYDPATPIVVHRTPAPAKPTSAPPTTPTPEKRSNTTNAMVFIAVLFAIAGITTIGIVWVSNKSTPTSAAQPSALAIALTPPTLPSVAAIPPPVVTVDVPALVASGVAITPPIRVVAPMPSTTIDPIVAPPPIVVATGSKRYGGTHGRRTGGDFSDCVTCGHQAFYAELDKLEPQISACFKASEREPPLHENVYYEVHVAADGHYTSFASMSDVTPNLDRCLQGVVYGVKLTTPKVGSFKVGFRGECIPNQTVGWGKKSCD